MEWKAERVHREKENERKNGLESKTWKSTEMEERENVKGRKRRKELIGKKSKEHHWNARTKTCKKEGN